MREPFLRTVHVTDRLAVAQLAPIAGGTSSPGWRIVERLDDEGTYITWPLLYATQAGAEEYVRETIA